MRLRKGVKLKAPAPSRIKYTEDAMGLIVASKPRALYSGQSALSELQRREEAAAMAVAVAQPHRGAVFDAAGHLVAPPEDRRLGTSLGRLCVRHKPRALAPWLLDAGTEYAAIIYRFKRALGVPCFRGSGDPLLARVDDATAQERREKAETDKRSVDGELLMVDRRGPIMMEAVCFDDIDAPMHWEAILVECLLAASDHFGFSPKNIRDARFDD